MLLLCALIVGYGSAWAEETIYDFGNIPTTGWSKNGGTQAINSVTWTYSSCTYIGVNNGRLQIGSKSSPQTTAWTIQTPVSSFGENIVIKAVEITAYTTAESATYDIEVGSSSVKSGALTTASATYSATNLNITSGSVVVTLTGSSSSKAIYLSNISVTYEEVSGPVKPTPELSFPQASYNAILGQTFTAPTLTNTYNVSPITWSSSQENVATVDGNGTVTLVGGGTTIIKASFDGTNDPTYASDEAQYELTVTDPSIITLWSEDFSSYEADDVPSGGTYGYNCTNGNGSGATKIYNQDNAGGTAPELLVAKSSGTFSATVPLNNASGTLTLTYKTNAKAMSVSTTTEGIAGGGSFNTDEEHTVTFTGVTTSMTSITIVFTATSGENVRLDDIELRGNGQQAAVEAPTFNKNGGTYYTAQTVELSCATEGATIKYSFDQENWQTYTEALTISETKTIYAKAEKDGAESTISSITITIAEKNNVVFNISNKELVYGESYTVTKGTYSGRDVQTDGNVTVTTDNENIVTVSGMKITAKAVGTATITLSAAEGDTYKAGNTTFTVTVTAPEGQTTAPGAPVVFNETFDKSEGTGGRDDEFSGNVGASSLNDKTDEVWATIGKNGAYHCIKLGTSSAAGTVTTREITLSGNATLSFDAAGWSTGENYVTVSITGGSIDGESSVQVTLENGKWNSYSYPVEATESSIQISFEMKRGFLDEIKLEKSGEAVVAPKLTLSASGYASYCCEYPLDFTNIDKDTFKAWYVSAVDMTSGDVTFSEITETIKGGEAFFLYGTPGAECQLAYAVSSSVVLNGNKLVGTLAPTYVENGNGIQNYGLSGGNFVKMGNGVVKANKSYLPVEVGTETPTRFNIIFESQEATGIMNVSREGTTDNRYYNLNGQRVMNPTKGMYIVNGKKVIIK